MLIIGAILGGVVVVFMLQNLAPVSVSFLLWNFEGSIAIIVILAVVIGMIISWFLSIPDLFQLSNLKSKNKRLQNDLELHKQKLSQAEAAPSPLGSENRTDLK
jgi:uncharacterized integral membrane protein